jgi:hypothetical protein
MPTPDMNLPLTLVVEFSDVQHLAFMRSISGDGGGQQFVRYCQAKIARSGVNRWTLTLRGEDVERWFRYRDDYGDGGFQQRLGRQPQPAALF